MALAQLIDEYLAGSSVLRRAVAGMTREQLLARPVPGKWSTLEVVCHLADFDPIIADRMKRIIAEEKPTLLGADETRFAAALAYHDRDLEEELTIIEERAAAGPHPAQAARIGPAAARHSQRTGPALPGTTFDGSDEPHHAPRQVHRGKADGSRVEVEQRLKSLHRGAAVARCSGHSAWNSHAAACKQGLACAGPRGYREHGHVQLGSSPADRLAATSSCRCSGHSKVRRGSTVRQDSMTP